MPIQGIRCSVPFCGSSKEEQTRTSCVLKTATVMLGTIALLAGILALSGIPSLHALGTAGGCALTVVGAALVLAGLFFWYPKKGPGKGNDVDEVHRQLEGTLEKLGKTIDATVGVKGNAKSSAKVDPQLLPYQEFYRESQDFIIVVGRFQNNEEDVEEALLYHANELRKIMQNPPDETPKRLSALNVRTFGDMTLLGLLDEITPLLEYYQKGFKRTEKIDEQLLAACVKAKAIVEQFKAEEFGLEARPSTPLS